MKTKIFAKGDSVKTAVSHGTVKNVAEFADHLEYLVQWPDQTASWIHEKNLSANPTKTSEPK